MIRDLDDGGFNKKPSKNIPAQFSQKTNRGFNIWGPIVNDRYEQVGFQESSAVGLNTWLVIDHSKDLNKTSVDFQKKNERNKEDFDHFMIHLEFKQLIELQQKIAKVIKYQIEERSKWYNE